MITADVAVVGGGIAGASLAAEIAGHASVVLIEAEDQPGTHATGRSAAFWTETYGGPGVQPLTSASGPWLASPPETFALHGFLSPRCALHLAQDTATVRLRDLTAAFPDVELLPLSEEQVRARVPGLRPQWAHGVAEPTCSDIDVARLHAAYLAQLRRLGGTIITGAPVRTIARDSDGWRIAAGAGEVACGVVVDAAGAWVDEVAQMASAMPIGIRPYRRTIVQLRVNPPAPADLPLVIDIEGGFYFKSEAGGRIWLSPHDETPCAAGDVRPEEIDIALAIDRLQAVVDWRVERVERAWAGLRSFAPDRLPVYGYDPRADGFFWYAGQGGFGIQTAPAAAKLAAGLLLENAPDAMVAHIDAAAYAPSRFSLFSPEEAKL